MPRSPHPPLVVRAILVFSLLGLGLAWSDGGRAVRAQEPAEPVAALLDGVWLSPAEAAAVNARLPVAVTIDNLSSGARPQIGLDHADLVYEYVVEAGITRFMAVFLRRDAEWIEPVRSVRTPNLYLVKELDAILASVGSAEPEGEANAGQQIHDWNVRHIDQRQTPSLFWRDRRRPIPHNVVTSTAAIRSQAEAQGWTGPSTVQPWPFKDDLTATNALGGFGGHIGYAFAWAGPAQRAYAVDWQYDPSTNGYRRSMAGRPHIDGRSRAVLTAKNVIVQFDRTRVVTGEGHVVYDSVGEGPAYVFLDSRVIEATWTKAGIEDRTRYWDAEGNEIAFNRGTTWVAILPYGSPLTWD
jgi:hypothetical protein